MKQILLLLFSMCWLAGCTANAGGQIDIERPDAEPTTGITDTENNVPTTEPTLSFEEVMASVTPPPTPLPVDVSHLPYPPPYIIGITPQPDDPPTGYPSVDLETLPDWGNVKIRTKALEAVSYANKSIAEGTLTNLVNEDDAFGARLILTIDVSRSWVGAEEQLVLTHESPGLYDLGELAIGDQLLVLVYEHPYDQDTRMLSLWRLDETGKYVSSYHVYPRHRVEPTQLYNLIEAYLNQ